MIVIPWVAAVVFILALTVASVTAGLLVQELFVGGWRRAANDHTREELLELAERRRPGRLL